MNEETVKNNIVVPYLKRLGFSEDEIDFEVGFSVRIGRSVVEVDKDIEDKKRGYLDILIKRDKRSLFIIETKPTNHKLTDKDRDQAISYARLVENIAPFAIVTNGIETKIFDSITKQTLSDSDLSSSNYIKNGELLTSLDDDLRYEAQKFFFGYNIHNLIQFSQSQIKSRMNAIRGSAELIHHKYIPELFVDNIELKNEFSNFITSNKLIFIIAGESGVGKTNYICNLARETSHDHPTLFFNCSLLYDDIFNTVSDEFNWTFSSKSSLPHLVKRLGALVKQHDKSLIIFLDAIDEWNRPNLPRELNEFIRRTREHNIKVVMSSKTSELKNFVKIAGYPVEFAEDLYSSSPTKLTHKIDDRFQSNASFEVQRLTQSQLNEAVIKYQKLFNFTGRVSGITLEESRLPFILRIISETYINSTRGIPADLNSIEILNTYLEYKLEKTKDKINSLDMLRKLGLEMYLKDKKEIDEFSFLDKQKYDSSNQSYSYLFSFNILTAKTDNLGKRSISFYFEKMRDYIIAFRSLDWQQLTKNQFRLEIDKCLMKNIGSGIIDLYALIAPDKHLEVIHEINLSNANKCIRIYNQIIKKLYPNLKEKFYPNKSNRLGMILLSLDDSRRLMAYGFRIIREPNNEKVAYVKVTDGAFFSRKKSSTNDIFHEYKVRILTFTNSVIFDQPEIKAKSFIKDQLTKLVLKGKLDESKNFGFASEIAYKIIHQKGKELGFGDQKQDNIMNISLISCKDALLALKKHKIHKIAHESYINQAIQDGKIVVNKRGPYRGYSIDMSEHRAAINDLATKMIKKKIEVPKLFPPLDENYETLLYAIKVIKKYQKTIGEPRLPSGDLKKPMYSLSSEVQDYSDAGITNYIRNYFQNVIREYRTLVRQNFQKLENLFPLYNSDPVHFFAEISSPEKYLWNNNLPDREINYAFLSSDEELFEIYVIPFRDRFKRFNHMNVRMNVRTKYGIKKASTIHSDLVSHFLKPRSFKFDTQIRSFVYDVLERELKETNTIGTTLLG